MKKLAVIIFSALMIFCATASAKEVTVTGMGAYHGEWGFREFTHPSTVLMGRNRFNLSLREHPYSDKVGERKLKILKLFSN